MGPTGARFFHDEWTNRREVIKMREVRKPEKILFCQILDIEAEDSRK